MIVSAVISMLLCIALRFIFIIGTGSTDDWGHLFYVQSRRQVKSPFNYKAIDSVLSGNKAYPQLFHYIISLFPDKYTVLGGRLLNIFFDCAVLAFSMLVANYFFNSVCLGVNSELYVAYVGLILATSPILLPTNARMKAMGARVFGCVLFVVFLALCFLVLTADTTTEMIVASVGVVIATQFVILASQFAIQVTIWTSIILSIAFLNAWFLLLMVASFLFAWKCNCFGTHDVLSGKLAHWKWYFRNAKSGTTPMARSRLSDHLRLPLWLIKNPQKAAEHFLKKSILIITSYSVLPFFLLAWFVIADNRLLEILLSEPLTEFLFWVVVAAATACYLTSLKPLQFLGQGERYFEYAMPAMALLYVYAVMSTDIPQVWLLYVVVFQIVGVLANYVFLSRHALRSSLQSEVKPVFQEVVSFLTQLKPAKIITVPTKLSFHLGAMLPARHKYYYRFVDVPGNGHDYMDQDHVDFDLIKPDFDYFNKKYGVDVIVISKKHMNYAFEKGIDYNPFLYNSIFENDDYIVLSI